jgi:hypothetical protein
MPCWPTRRGNTKQKGLTIPGPASQQAVMAVRDQKVDSARMTRVSTLSLARPASFRPFEAGRVRNAG